MSSTLDIEDLNGASEFEHVYRVRCSDSGLDAFIAIHSTVLGPACGGCRVWSYPEPSDGQADVLRLARGMTYKNALAELRFGGGKAVILGPIPEEKRQHIFTRFGNAVEQLGGSYITAEDVGVGVVDMETVSTETNFVSGLRDRGAGCGGDPSPSTARGVLRGIEAAAKEQYGRDDLDGLTVAVQGLGNVGRKLSVLLLEKGARLFVSDIDKDRAEQFCHGRNATYVKPEFILLSDAQVIAPCALGRAITEEVATAMHAGVVAGAANNQLATNEVGEILMNRGILYAPDYVINAGGIIMAEAEYYNSDNQKGVNTKIDRIFDRTLDILSRSNHDGRPPHLHANELAQAIVERRAQEIAARI